MNPSTDDNKAESTSKSEDNDNPPEDEQYNWNNQNAPTTNNPSEHQHQNNNSIESSMSQIFGTKTPGTIDMIQQYQDVFCQILKIYPLPDPILLQFKKAKWINPSIIVNTFGGNITALAQKLCFHNSSIFINGFPDITKSLIRFSRHEPGIPIQGSPFSSKMWIKSKKNNDYDAKFLTLSVEQRAIIADVMTDEQHDMSLYLLFQELSIKVRDFTANFIENQSLCQQSQCSSQENTSNNISQPSSSQWSNNKKNLNNSHNTSHFSYLKHPATTSYISRRLVYH